jgi:hypothetical protein
MKYSSRGEGGRRCSVDIRIKCHDSAESRDMLLISEVQTSNALFVSRYAYKLKLRYLLR